MSQICTINNAVKEEVPSFKGCKSIKLRSEIRGAFENRDIQLVALLVQSNTYFISTCYNLYRYTSKLYKYEPLELVRNILY